MLDVLCIGDSVIDIFLKIPSSDSRFKLDKEKKELLIKYGEKISVEKYIIGVGGNATNTAVGLSRLSLNVGICAEIGNDEFSQKIITNFKKEKIDTSFLTTTKDAQTSITVALSYDGDRTLFTEHVTRNHNFSFDKLETKLIYLTSLGHVWENTYEKVYEYIKNNNVKLAFNPGALQIEKRNKFVMNIIEKSDYLFVNKEEAEELLYGKELNIGGDKIIKKLLYGLKGLGAKNIIITDSDNGSYCEDEDGSLINLASIKTEIVEKTGAGDAYTAGFIGAMLKGKDIKTAMLWGAINAASVIKYVGAQEGLLNENEIEREVGLLKHVPFEKFT